MNIMNVEIIIKGLIALAPLFEPDGADHMTALVVDSKQAPPEAVCMQQHTPEIEFPTTESQCRDDRTNGCRWNSSTGTCICDLNHQDITLLPDANSAKKLQRLGPPRAMPFNSQVELENTFDYEYSAGSVSYVAHLSRLGNYSLNPALLEPAPPAILAARFRFPFDFLMACDHASRPDDGSDNVHALEFRKLGAQANPGDHRQVAAQSLVARTTLDTSSRNPTLTLTRFDGTAEHTFELADTRPKPIQIKLRNHRIARLPLDDPCDGGVGRDFAFFYDLVNDPPTWEDRPVPRVKHTWWKAYADVVPESCKDYKTPTSRPICPMVVIE